MEPHLKSNKIILAAHVGIFMRQSCCSQSQHLSSHVTFWRSSDVFRLVNYAVLRSSRTVNKILTSRWCKHIWQTT